MKTCKVKMCFYLNFRGLPFYVDPVHYGIYKLSSNFKPTETWYFCDSSLIL